MAFPSFEQKWPANAYVFSHGGHVSESFQRDQVNIKRRRMEQTQTAIGLALSDIDKADYGNDILNFMFESEVNTIPDVASIDIQTEIEWYMRPYLLDFLVEAHAAFSLSSESFFLTLNILDRYCSKRVVYRKHYQLVGCTALLIAAKYDETSKQVPHVKELMGMCCGLYDEDMFIQMERHVLMTLEWHIGAPTVPAFIRTALDDAPRDSEVEHLAMYIGEIAMYHRQFISLRPSDLAKACIALSYYVLGRQNLLGEFHWSATQDRALIAALSAALPTASEILVQKYKQPHHSYVALAAHSFVARQIAMAQAMQTRINTGLASNNTSNTLTPRKRRFPYDESDLPPTPPITPNVDAFTKMYGPPQVVFNSPDTPEQDVPQSYNASFTMVDAP